MALALLVIGAVVGLRMARQQANRITAKPTPTVLFSPSAQPTASASPTPLSSWITRRVPLAGQLYYGMALDSSAVFALYTPTANNPHDTSQTTLARIDRTTGRVVTNGPFAGGFQLLRVDAGLWVVGGMSGGPTVDKYWMDLVDPVTLQVKSRTWVPGRPGPGVFGLPELTGASKLLWLGYGQQIYRLDPATGKILATVSFSGTVTSVSLDPSGQHLYVGIEPTSSQDNQDQIVELDSNTGARLASAPTGGAGLGGPHVVGSADGVWVAYATGMMGQVEHRSASNLALLPIPSQFGHTNGVSVVVGAGSVWFVDGGAQRVACADPRTGTIAASTELPFPTVLVTDSKGTYVAVQDEVDFLQPNSCPH
ncbi:MAG TPA: hypothetical protein VHK65_06375 [Candidatus Dormibacteraeota bacterium]|nr:hypothetical protein [Candidatus Dormibacteraeota bacterium]